RSVAIRRMSPPLPRKGRRRSQAAVQGCRRLNAPFGMHNSAGNKPATIQTSAKDAHRSKFDFQSSIRRSGITWDNRDERLAALRNAVAGKISAAAELAGACSLVVPRPGVEPGLEVPETSVMSFSLPGRR